MVLWLIIQTFFHVWYLNIFWLQIHWDKNDVDLIPNGISVSVDQSNK